jgi:hypothetical protein
MSHYDEWYVPVSVSNLHWTKYGYGMLSEFVRKLCVLALSSQKTYNSDLPVFVSVCDNRCLHKTGCYSLIHGKNTYGLCPVCLQKMRETTKGGMYGP